MKKRTKSLLAAFCTMALCGCLIAGSTYALFTDTASVNIAVTSGKVDVEAKVKDGTLKTYSATTEKTDTTTEIKDIESSKLGDFAGTYYYDTTKVNGTFTNGGTAVLSTNEYNESQLTLNNMTPGDKVDFDIEITNNSNVAIQYRIDFQSADTVKDSGDNILMSALNFSVSGLPAYQDDAATRQFNGLSTYITEWTKWEVPSSEDKTSIVNAEIELPLDAGNIYQGKDITIIFKVEAVQANASISSSSTKLASPKVIEASSIGGSQSGSVKANVTMPNGTLLNGEDVSLSISEIATNDVVIDSDANTAKDSMIKAITNNNNSSTTYNILLSGISEENTEYVSVVLTGIENDVQNVYHSGSAMTKLDVGSEPISDKNDDNYNEYGYFIYNNSDKTLTIYTTSFSPFTVEYKYDGGLGTSGKPYLISTAKQLQNIESGTSSQRLYYQLTKSIDFTSDNIVIGTDSWDDKVSCYLTKKQYCSIDGNGSSINLSDTKAYLISYTVDVTIKNLIINNIHQSLIENAEYNIVFENVSTYGSMNVDGNCAVFVQYTGHLYNNTNSNFKNIKNYVTINGIGTSGDYNAIFIAYLLNNHDVYFENCVNYGTMNCGQSSMFLGNLSKSPTVNLTIKNCSNQGEIRSTNFIITDIYTHSDFAAVIVNHLGIIKIWNDEKDYWDEVKEDYDYLQNTPMGPNDTSTIIKNDDGTFSFSKTTVTGATKYVVYIGLYASIKNGGSDRYYVKETIKVSEAENYTTNLALYSFVDQAWVDANNNATQGEDGAGNKTYTLDGVTYYYLDDNTLTLNGNVCQATMVYVAVFNEKGDLLASNAYTNA